MRRWAFTVILGAVMLAAPLLAQKQGQLFMSIISPDGKPVEGLTADEVSILEDGTECKTIKVEALTWPTKVQVLVDNGRANTEPINPLRDGLKEFFNLMPDGIELSLYVTAPTARAVVKPTTDRKKLLDAISLIAPDNGVGQFFDALLEASERVDKDKTPGYPMIVMVGSALGVMRASDRDFEKLQANMFNHGIRTHVLVNIPSGGNAGGSQVDLGMNVAKFGGGRYESFNITTRLATLLPEIGKTVAESAQAQSHQYRITYERPAKPNERAAIGASVKRQGTVKLSLHGNQ